MPTSRLRLDWSLKYYDERNDFVRDYVTNNEIFKSHPATPDELEMMANYILWGKIRETDAPLDDPESLGLPSKNGDWSKTKKTESLDELMEQPGFNEASFCTKNRPPLKIKRETISRSEIRKEAPEWLLEEFEQLWKWIDELDLKIGIYELKHGKRTKPIREQLIKKFDDAQIAAAEKSVESWSGYYYLKQRHELIDLRRRQYALRDSYRSGTIFAYEPYHEPIDPPDWEVGIEVLPLGMKDECGIAQYAFTNWDDIHPGMIKDDDIAKKLTKFYWEKEEWKPSGNQQFLDFRDPDHVYAMFQQFYELKDAGENNELTKRLMATLEYYMNAAELTDLQREILDAKLKHDKNIDIAIRVNKKWGKSYTPNYISTIFKQRIVPRICDAAKVHQQKIGAIWFEEEWKKCSTCGRILLRNEDNFTHKARSRDGFASRCKACEKAARLKK